MRVLVFGAGVIGRIYAARLSLAGNRVVLVARGAAVTALAEGVTICENGAEETTAHVEIVSHASVADTIDVAFLAVRREQLAAAAPEFARIPSRISVSLTDVPLDLRGLSDLIGAERFVAGFPGVAGTISASGRVDFIDVRQQPTTVGSSPRSQEVAGLLNAAGFRTATVPDMECWLQTHAIFITAFEAAIVKAHGDLASLAQDYSAVHDIVATVRQGLLAFESRGGRVSPPALKTIFIRMPDWFAVRYWMRQLAGPLGRIGFLPHAMKSRDNELPALLEDVHVLTGL